MRGRFGGLGKTDGEKVCVCVCVCEREKLLGIKTFIISSLQILTGQDPYYAEYSLADKRRKM